MKHSTIHNYDLNIAKINKISENLSTLIPENNAKFIMEYHLKIIAHLFTVIE